MLFSCHSVCVNDFLRVNDSAASSKAGGVRFAEENAAAAAAAHSHVHFDEKLHDSVVMVIPESDGNFLVKVSLCHVYDLVCWESSTRSCLWYLHILYRKHALIFYFQFIEYNILEKIKLVCLFSMLDQYIKFNKQVIELNVSYYRNFNFSKQTVTI